MFISKRCNCLSKLSQCCQCGKDTETLSKDLSLLSVKSRLEILFHLQDRPHCVCDLISHTGMSQSLISHHLSDLTKANLVANKREGKYLDYYLTDKGKRFLEAILIMFTMKGGEKKYGTP